MDGVGLGEPDVAIDACALVEPAVTEAGVDAGYDAVLSADGEKVGEVEVEGRVAVVIAADEAAVDPDEDIAEDSVEVDGDAAACVGCGNVEGAAVPADAALGITAADGLVAVRHLDVVVDEGEFDGPVVGQVELTPFGVVELDLGEIEFAGLGKVTLAVAEAEILCGIDRVAELEFPAEVEEKLFSRGQSRQGHVRLGKGGLRAGPG
jgi:hypothetical protein